MIFICHGELNANRVLMQIKTQHLVQGQVKRGTRKWNMPGQWYRGMNSGD